MNKLFEHKQHFTFILAFFVRGIPTTRNFWNISPALKKTNNRCYHVSLHRHDRIHTYIDTYIDTYIYIICKKGMICVSKQVQ